MNRPDYTRTPLPAHVAEQDQRDSLLAELVASYRAAPATVDGGRRWMESAFLRIGEACPDRYYVTALAVQAVMELAADR